MPSKRNMRLCMSPFFKGTNTVAAYYTLSNGSVARAHGATARLRRNTPNELPVIILGRMGVDREAAGQGVATDLLQDAIERALVASERVGCVALIVHPLTERLEQFYANYAGSGTALICHPRR